MLSRNFPVDVVELRKYENDLKQEFRHLIGYNRDDVYAFITSLLIHGMVVYTLHCLAIAKFGAQELFFAQRKHIETQDLIFILKREPVKNHKLKFTQTPTKK